MRASPSRLARRVTALTAPAALALALALTLATAGCDRTPVDGPVTIRFWGMGREGEVVRELVRTFESLHPDIRVEVQQIPWSAAHEKLLTAHVGRSTPDVAQLGNTWIGEFVALDALRPLDALVDSSAVVDPAAYFPGIWATNVVGRTVWGVPWYVDTRVLFYRTDLLARAGRDSIPDTWDAWRETMRAVQAAGSPGDHAVFLPLNEWTQPVIFGLQAGSPLLAENDTRGEFSGEAFARAFAFYVDLFREGLAPPVGNNEIANLYQEFAAGRFAMFVSGPWNLGEVARRLPPELQDAWATAPLPGPDGAASGLSLAGGSSLVVFRGSRHAEAAWALVEYLSRPESQLEFFRLTGDLPARTESWDDPALTGDPRIAAFGTQLRRVVPTPMIPEWEQIAARVQERAESAVRGAASPEEALVQLDRDVDRILEKRRWLLEHGRLPGGGPAPGAAGAGAAAGGAAGAP